MIKSNKSSQQTRQQAIAHWRAIQRDPNTAPLMRMAALREINKLMGLRAS